MAESPPVTVVETPEFLAATRKLMSEDERTLLVDHLSRHPTDGDLIPSAGGVRKLRWGLEGRGKRGGARVIYFYHSANLPLFALTAYAKNERDDLTPEQRDGFRSLAKSIAEAYAKKGRRKRT
jgi:hypothetical protein